MLIYILDPEAGSRELLLTRVREALRKAQLKRVDVVDGDFELLLSKAGKEVPTAVFLGPGCYRSIEESVTRLRSFYPKVPLAVVLDNSVYSSEALDLRRYLSARIMPLADIAQMAQFIIDSSGVVGGTAAQSVITFCQMKGGVGASTLAAAFAGCWAEHELKVALIDLDDTNPHLTSWSGASPASRRVVGELIRKGEVTANRLREICFPVTGYGDSLVVVPQPELYQESFHFKADVIEGAPSILEYVQSLIAALQEQYDAVVIDAGRSWGLATFSALPLSQSVILVSDDDRTSLNLSIEQMLRMYRESDDPAEFDFSRWRILINGVTDKILKESEVVNRFKETELFGESPQVHSVSYTDPGREWTVKQPGARKGKDGEIGFRPTLYSLSEGFVKIQIKEVAYQLLPFRQGESEQGNLGLRQKLQKIVTFLS